MPLKIKGQKQPSFKKIILNGDLIAMVGGRIGKDGIHGATFSSKPLETHTPVSVVQIGDPITQKKMIDYVLEARDKGLYRTLTDNGAGGLSSSVGEMACLSGGCKLHLHKAPLKYEGLAPWEILISEAQERMTLAVPPRKKEDLLTLAKVHDVEVSFLGTFTNTGYFEAFYNEKQVAFIFMKFLHEGVPRLHLKATWKPYITSLNKKTMETNQMLNTFEKKYASNHERLISIMLSRPNIASKEYWVRQYDHEVQGRTIIKPFGGFYEEGPMDAAVLRPVYNSDKGLVISCGIAPKYSVGDCYHMAQAAIDEAVRNAVAAGGDPATLVGLDNFCWPDPVQSHANQDGHLKLGQLVRSNQGIKDICLHYKLPIISGKDSMKNDYCHNNVKESILPTLLFTVVATMPSISHAMTTDWKQPGSNLYVLGNTKDEMGMSELYDALGIPSTNIPTISHPKEHYHLYKTLYEAISKGYVLSCHDVSDGGLFCAVVEGAIGGMLGATITLDNISPTLPLLTKMYCESQGRFVVELNPKTEADCLALFSKTCMYKIGHVIPSKVIKVHANQKLLFRLNVPKMRTLWKEALRIKSHESY